MQTFECYSHSMNGQTSFEDIECSGCLSSGQMDGNWKKCVKSSILTHGMSLICDKSFTTQNLWFFRSNV